jgi:phage-related holin
MSSSDSPPPGNPETYRPPVICIAALLDVYIDLLGIDLVQVTTLFYIGPELLSIIRNAAIAGVPVPSQFTQVLRYFNQESESKEVK